MPSERDAAASITDKIIGAVTIKSAAASREFRKHLVEQLTALYRKGLPEDEFYRRAFTIIVRSIRENAKVQAGLLTDAQVAAWIHGADQIASRLPFAAVEAIAGTSRFPPVRGPSTPYEPGEPGPLIRLPKLIEASRDLRERQLLMPEDFYDISNAYRRSSLFTVSRFEYDAIQRTQGILSEVVAEGPSLTSFRQRMNEAEISSPLGPGHMENVYRTNIQTALSNGQDRLLAHPVVSGVFPYYKRMPIRDARLTELCAILARSGINGTAIYRHDDPIGQLFKIPSHFQCRCHRSVLSVNAAAEQGIEEAIEYLDTGRWPQTPAWVPFPQLTAEAQKTWDAWTRNAA